MANTEIVSTVIELVMEVLSLSESALTMTEETLLLGNIPEFDSMSIVSVIAALEESFEMEIPDDELSAEVFESIGSIASFVEELLN